MLGSVSHRRRERERAVWSAWGRYQSVLFDVEPLWIKGCRAASSMEETFSTSAAMAKKAVCALYRHFLETPLPDLDKKGEDKKSKRNKPFGLSFRVKTTSSTQWPISPQGSRIKL